MSGKWRRTECGWMDKTAFGRGLLIDRQMNHGNSETVTPIQHRSNIGLNVLSFKFNS